MTGAQEQAYARLRKKKSKVRLLGSIGDVVQVEWVEKNVFDEDRRVVATIAPQGRVVEQP